MEISNSKRIILCINWHIICHTLFQGSYSQKGFSNSSAKNPAYVSHKKLQNLISKLNFYKLIPYPMDNCFTGRRDRSRQTPEKDVLYILPAGPVTECAFARWRIVLHFLFTYWRHSIFFVSNPSKTPSKLIAGLVGWALPVHWIGY